MTDTSRMPLFDSNGDWLFHWIETAHFDRAGRRGRRNTIRF
jgi:hypothetical protein